MKSKKTTAASGKLYTYKDIRKMAKLTQSELAKKIGIHRISYLNIENYKTYPKITTLYNYQHKILNKLNLTINNLKTLKSEY